MRLKGIPINPIIPNIQIHESNMGINVITASSILP